MVEVRKHTSGHVPPAIIEINLHIHSLDQNLNCLDKQGCSFFMQTMRTDEPAQADLSLFLFLFGFYSPFKTQKQKRQMVSNTIWSIRTKYFHLKLNTKQTSF